MCVTLYKTQGNQTYNIVWLYKYHLTMAYPDGYKISRPHPQ